MKTQPDPSPYGTYAHADRLGYAYCNECAATHAAETGDELDEYTPDPHERCDVCKAALHPEPRPLWLRGNLTKRGELP